MVRWFRFLAGVVALGLLVPACASKSSETGGETNWACSADVDCTGALSCVEHRCVVTSASATGAGGAPSDAAEPSSGGNAGYHGPPDATAPAPVGLSAECPDIDLEAIQRDSGGPVSFKDDVMPIFGATCTASDCHKAPEKKAGLYLGVRCLTDPQTKICTFPAEPDPSSTSSNPPMPLTDAIVDDVYDNLVNAQARTTPTHVRVVPGSLGDSFLLDSLMGVENDRGYTDCQNQDPSHTLNPMPCGASMPLNSPALCAGSSRPRFLTIARWIAQGAPKN